MKTNQLFGKAIFSALFAGAMMFGSSAAFAQVKVGDNPTLINAGSALEIESTNKGLLMPRISLTNTTTWGLGGTAVAGMHVFNTNTAITSSTTSYPTLAAKIGEYYFDGTGWVALAPLTKSTAVTAFSQSTPGVTVNMPGFTGTICNSLACATDMGLNSTFTVVNPVNDVILNATGSYAISNQNGDVAFNYYIAVDKTTPGVFEVVGNYYAQSSGTTCSGGSINFLVALKNLPARNYSIKMYVAPWFNGGTNPVVLGVGKKPSATCGNNDFANNKLIISVSQ